MHNPLFKPLLLLAFLSLGLPTAGHAQVIKVKSTTLIKSTQDSVTERIELTSKYFGDATLVKRRSLAKSEKKWATSAQPALFILSGIQTGAKTVGLLPEIPGVTVVSIEYPISADDTSINRMKEVTLLFPKIQQQTLMTYVWLSKLPEIDSRKITSINISFGSFIAPFSLRALADLGYVPYRTVFLFGGTTLGGFVEPYLGTITAASNDRIDVSEFNKSLKGIEPAQHLKYLKGPFLVINGTDDEIIPASSSEDLQNLLPEPKEIFNLPTGHIDTDKPEVIEATLDKVIEWLNSEDAI